MQQTVAVLNPSAGHYFIISHSLLYCSISQRITRHESSCINARTLIIFFSIQEEGFSFARQVATGLLIQIFALSKTSPAFFLMEGQLQNASIKEEINT